ncbi:glycosyltransferase [Bacillus sp. FSL W7-1360]
MVTSYTFVIHHNGGGGIAQSMRAMSSPMIFCYKRGAQYIFTNPTGKKEYLPTMKRVAQKLQKFPIKGIVIRHLANIPLQDCLWLVQQIKSPLTIYLHDFFAICPRLFFVRKNGDYCHIPTSSSTCDACIHPDKIKQMKMMLRPHTPSITKWRNTFYTLFKKATRIIAPSHTVKQIYASFFPDVSIDVVPNVVALKRHSLPKKTPHLPLRVALLGHLFRHKGEQPVKELLTYLKSNPLPVQLYSYGQVARVLRASPLLIQRGTYTTANIEKKLLADEIDIVCIPSICPEAFSHTTHEALTLGYPVLCFHLGAQAETVLKKQGGWVVKTHNGKGLYKQLDYLCQHLDEVSLLKQQLQFN